MQTFICFVPNATQEVLFAERIDKVVPTGLGSLTDPIHLSSLALVSRRRWCLRRRHATVLSGSHVDPCHAFCERQDQESEFNDQLHRDVDHEEVVSRDGDMSIQSKHFEQGSSHDEQVHQEADQVDDPEVDHGLRGGNCQSNGQEEAGQGTDVRCVAEEDDGFVRRNSVTLVHAERHDVDPDQGVEDEYRSQHLHDQVPVDLQLLPRTSHPLMLIWFDFLFKASKYVSYSLWR